mmetsp:Transcript_87312/g.174698  ORF Transcript_87312/g.174698 Transcript_87312/m.174698 type:complete len:228 (+) Transcript_87312:1512-2195(+)
MPVALKASTERTTSNHCRCVLACGSKCAAEAFCTCDSSHWLAALRLASSACRLAMCCCLRFRASRARSLLLSLRSSLERPPRPFFSRLGGEYASSSLSSSSSSSLASTNPFTPSPRRRFRVGGSRSSSVARSKESRSVLEGKPRESSSEVTSNTSSGKKRESKISDIFRGFAGNLVWCSLGVVKFNAMIDPSNLSCFDTIRSASTTTTGRTTDTEQSHEQVVLSADN